MGGEWEVDAECGRMWRIAEETTRAREREDARTSQVRMQGSAGITGSTGSTTGGTICRSGRARVETGSVQGPSRARPGLSGSAANHSDHSSGSRGRGWERMGARDDARAPEPAPER